MRLPAGWLAGWPVGWLDTAQAAGLLLAMLCWGANLAAVLFDEGRVRCALIQCISEPVGSVSSLCESVLLHWVCAEFYPFSARASTCCAHENPCVA